jgi:hypothetical protein
MLRHQRPLVMSVLAAGAMISSLQPTVAQTPASPPDPRPSPYLNLRGPGAGTPISTIDSFNGSVGIVALHGTGTDGHGSPLTWEADMRYLQGFYIARDGIARTGTFCFI